MARKGITYDRKTNTFIGLTDVIMKQLCDTYKNLDVDCELKKMGLWLNSPKGLRRRGTIAFIMNWLNSTSENEINIEEQIETLPKGELSELIKDYLQGLWKDRDHIFLFNTIR